MSLAGAAMGGVFIILGLCLLVAVLAVAEAIVMAVEDYGPAAVIVVGAVGGLIVTGIVLGGLFL